MRVCYIAAAMLAVVGANGALIAQTVPRDDGQVISLRERWLKRQRAGGAIVYQFSGTELKWDRANGSNELPERRRLTAKGLMRCREFALIMDLSSVPKNRVVLLVNKAAFHECRYDHHSQPTVTHSRTASRDSNFIYVLPLALAYGIVPLDPLQHDEYYPTYDDSTKTAAIPSTVQGSRPLIVSLNASDGRTVSVDTSADGSVKSLRLFQHSATILQVSNSYNTKSQLQSFSVVEFAASGEVARRLDAKVTKLEEAKGLVDLDFATPRNQRELEMLVLEKLDESVAVSSRMTIDEIAAAIEKGLGGKVPVRVIHEAFEQPPEYPRVTYSFSGGTESLAAILFQRLRQNGADFCISYNGLVLLPRHVAWEAAETREYSPRTYGLSSGELNDLLYNSAVLDDWRDVGGMARIQVDEATGKVVVFHGQSDHLRFSQALQHQLRAQEER